MPRNGDLDFPSLPCVPSADVWPLQEVCPCWYPLRHGRRSHPCPSGGGRMGTLPRMQASRGVDSRLLSHNLPVQQAVLLPLRGDVEELHLPAVGRTAAAGDCACPRGERTSRRSPPAPRATSSGAGHSGSREAACGSRVRALVGLSPWRRRMRTLLRLPA